MRDEIESRIWVEHGPAFCAFINDAIDKAWHALKRLSARSFDAPWRAEDECAAE